jgi:hypothetical protein
VVRGDRHIDPNEEIIDEIWFVLDDATTLFSDFDAFVCSGDGSDRRASVINFVPFADCSKDRGTLDRLVLL